VLYSDHGSDFTSARLERVCLDTHIRLIHSRVGIPQGRGKVERFYRTVTSELLPHLPGHIPHGTGGTPTSAPALTLEQLDAVLERFVVEDYHRRTHSETGQLPVARWIGDGWIPRTPAQPDDLDLLLLTAATGRKVQRDGIRFANTSYISPVLAACVGESVTVRYDPRDAAELQVYHHDQYPCRAIAPELAADAVTLKQLQDARNAQRKALKQQLRERRSLADALPADHRYIPRRLARYPQLYSRIGFAHEYRPLNPDELTAVLTRRWHADGLAPGSGIDDDDDDDDDDDEQLTRTVAIATIARITGGNFRLVDRLLTQIQRIQQINSLRTISPEVVEAAREALLIGS